MPEARAAGRVRFSPIQHLRRLLSSHQQLVDAELVQEAVGSGATVISELTVRGVGTVQGTLAIVTINPRTGSAWLEADLHDGTGTLTLIWMGRRVIPGIVAGAKLRVHGRITVDDGRLAIFNPAYELLV
jgi:hypothetical protein